MKALFLVPASGGGVESSTFQLTSTASATQPFMIGLGFGAGDIPNYPVTDATTSAVVVKRRWNDGSVKHAIACGTHALTANVPATITVTNSASPPGGTPLTSADITAAAPTASATFSSGITADISLASLFASPFRTWISSTEMVECHYRSAAVGGDASLVLWFQVRLFANGRKWVRVIVENGYLDVTTVDKSYTVLIVVGGTTLVNAAMTHYAHSRHIAEAWIGADPAVTPKHDSAYLMSTKLVPNYGFPGTPDSATLDLLTQTYAYNPAFGDFEEDMHGAGDNPMIALLSQWDAHYVKSGDPRAWRSVIAHAKILNNYPIVWNDSATGLPPLPTDRPTWTLNGAGGGGAEYWDAGTLIYEIPHHPSVPYLAYLITGDYYFLETLENAAVFNYLARPSSATSSPDPVTAGTGTSRLLGGQTRSVGWGNRTIGMLAGIGPTGDSIVEDYRTLLAFQASTWNTHRQISGMNPLGIIFAPEAGQNWHGPGNFSPWMNNFWIQSWGFVSDIEPFTDMTTWDAVRDHLYKAVVGMLGDSSGYGFAYAAPYSAEVASGDTFDPRDYYTTWRKVFTETFNAIATATIYSGGSGYAVNDIVTILVLFPGITTPATLRVTSVSGGVVTGISLESAGFGYSEFEAYPTTGGGGSGLFVNITIVANDTNALTYTTTLQGGSGGAPNLAATGYWGNLMPAIAYAVDHGATGAAASWARMIGATNWSTIEGAAWDEDPKWGIVPR